MSENLKPKALVVDDIEFNRKLAIVFFQKLGWEATGVDGGVAALAWLREHSDTALILLDISMPDMDGEEVFQHLRAEPLTAPIPVVAYTAHAMSSDVRRYLDSGFDGVLLKPISLQGLKEIIDTLPAKAALP